jgi:hypothetical protein
MKRFFVLFVSLIIVLGCGRSFAATVRAEASPLLAPGYIEPGVPFTIDLYMNNNDVAEHIGYSMPFAIYSPDLSITNIIHRNVHGYSADSIPYGASYNDSSILMLNGFASYWTMINKWFGFSWNGVLPDTINHTTATISGWPPGLGEKLYIQFALQVNQEGTLCIDSIQHANYIYDWLFDFPTTFNGPYCWEVGYPPQNPEITVDVDSMTFTGVENQPPPPPQVIHITNTGAGTLNWTATWQSTWLSVSPAFGTAPSTVQVYANTTGLTPGTYYDSVKVSDPNATNNPVYIPVKLVVTEPPPTIHLSPTFFTFNAIVDSTNPPDQMMSITNTGGGTLEWTATHSHSWLTIYPASGVGDDSVTLSVNISGLSIGTYYDTVSVSDPDATNNPQKAIVKLVVASSFPVMELSPSFIYIPVATDERLPANQYFDVTNVGAGEMDYYAEEFSTRIKELIPDSGSVPQTVMIKFDSVFGNAGTDYFDTIWVYSNEAANSPQLLIIQFHLSTNPGRMAVSRDSVVVNWYECGPGISPPPHPTITVYNIGGEPFTFDITYHSTWLLPSATSGSAPKTISLDFDYKGLSPGTYRDTMVITAYYAIGSPKRVPVILHILPTSATPLIITDRDTLIFAAQEERAGKDYFLEVNNYFPGCMAWQIQEAVSWVNYTIDSSEGNTYPWDVRFQPNGFGMIMGTYFDSGQIVAPTASNSPYDLYFKVYIWKLHGDCDYNGVINILDVVYFIRYLYYGGPAPKPELAVGDCNCDYRINIVDITAIINYLYYGAGPLCGNPY